MADSFKVVIPARYASTRLPGKPLLDIAGKPMVQHVYDIACASGAQQVVIATDDTRIEQVAKAFGAEVCMTSAGHNSGTDRLAETSRKMGWGDDEIIVNVQGDEPQIPTGLIKQVAAGLAKNKAAVVSTLCSVIKTIEELQDPNVVKLVKDAQGFALYFSRAPIPWARDEFAKGVLSLPVGIDYFRHLGIYAYRAGYLQEYTRLAACELETIESLEQLRVLWHGAKIFVDQAMVEPGHGVDTAEDLERVRKAIKKARP